MNFYTTSLPLVVVRSHSERACPLTAADYHLKEYREEREEAVRQRDGELDLGDVEHLVFLLDVPVVCRRVIVRSSI